MTKWLITRDIIPVNNLYFINVGRHVLQITDTLNTDNHSVTILQENLRLTKDADAVRRPGGNQIAGL